MLAQKFIEAKIDAVEIDKDAAAFKLLIEILKDRLLLIV